MVAEHTRFPSRKELVQLVGTFLFVSFAWIFFRSPDLPSATGYIGRIVEDSFYHPEQFLHFPKYMNVFLYIVPLIIVDWYFRRNERHLPFPLPKWLRMICYLVLIELVLFHLKVESDFIYFQF